MTLKSYIKNQFEREYEQSILKKIINNQLEQVYQPSFLNKTWTAKLTKIIYDEIQKTNRTIDLDRNINNQFEQKYY